MVEVLEQVNEGAKQFKRVVAKTAEGMTYPTCSGRSFPQPAGEKTSSPTRPIKVRGLEKSTYSPYAREHSGSVALALSMSAFIVRGTHMVWLFRCARACLPVEILSLLASARTCVNEVWKEGRTEDWEESGVVRSDQVKRWDEPISISGGR